MKPGAYDGKARDARIVDAWLTRMTTYLKLTKTPEGDKVELASSYLESDAYDWFIGNQTTLLAGTFDVFKASFRDHFVPQNHKIAVYNEYKRLKQNGLSVSEYSIKIKALADQIPDFVPTATRDLDFVTGLFDDIRRSLVSQPPVPGETWNALVGRALRVKKHCALVINALPIDSILHSRVLVVTLPKVSLHAPIVSATLLVPVTGDKNPPTRLCLPLSSDSNLSPISKRNF